ncbi:DUF4232 domain-containing protein [Actinacidiphila yeochonensis]|uniref:DUF4232 domain-containing protein n=1 Tax=Actinacidiphila yeochonensis TaxID=89050 RepID=UPI0005642828|nr:DUF4232 domain-containing protein [Actinacidiphila yeochonensis]
MRTSRRIAAAVAATAAALAGGTGAGVAQAVPAVPRAAAPSACRPANHLAEITEADGTAGHRHYRVTLTAPRGYEPCELAGSPTDARFSDGGADTGVTAGRYGDQDGVVVFGPGHPVHFDIQVPDSGRGVAADEASFTLQAPDGEIPGTSFADGALQVAAGTLVGPVQPGA